MKKIAYSEANNNFRHFVSLEYEYLKLFVNSTTLLVAAFWLVGAIASLRYLIIFIALFLSVGILVTELRYSQYFKYFFSVAEEIELENSGRQLSRISKNFNRPLLGIRSTNVIITFYIFFLLCWLFILFLDILDIQFYESALQQIIDRSRV